MSVLVDVLVEGSAFPHLRSSVVLARTSSRAWLIDCGAPEDRGDLVAALRGRGLTPADIGGILLTHLHGDHYANVDLFPSAVLYVHEQELESLRALEECRSASELATHLHNEYELLHPFHLRLVTQWVMSRGCLLISGRRHIRSLRSDTTIDEAMTMVESPGHSIGHMSVRLATDSGDTWVIGDSLHSPDELCAGESGRPSICWNQAARARSVAAFAHRTGLLIPGHGPPVRLPPPPPNPGGARLLGS